MRRQKPQKGTSAMDILSKISIVLAGLIFLTILAALGQALPFTAGQWMKLAIWVFIILCATTVAKGIKRGYFRE